jgi:hypothetical protein
VIQNGQLFSPWWFDPSSVRGQDCAVKRAVLWLLAIALVSADALTTSSAQFATTENGWPAITEQTRPWTRWWWLGSAVDPPGLTAELEALQSAGLGGVEITPIYGASGAEAQFVPYLSDRWMDLLQHTLREARRLDLGVDIATGTGWPFGGPWVDERDACRALAYRTWDVNGGQRLTERVTLEQSPLVRAIGNQIYEVLETVPGERAPQGTRAAPLTRPGVRALRITDLKEPVTANPDLQGLALEQVRYPTSLPLEALVAYSATGSTIDLTKRVSTDGTLDWVAPEGNWTLYGVFLGWHGKLVERAAPGGEGNVIDHFSRGAIRAYLARFDRAFARVRPDGLRAFFNDSYEVDDAQGQADGTPRLFDEFVRRRGYDLRAHLPELFGAASEERQRIVADYRQTISDLLLDTFTTEWRAWARQHGAAVRNQAHGSPANLLDLYAASDIPETEGNEIPRFKWATSAAHVAGRTLVSAEAATWLGEHFRSTLADVRAAVDRFFVAGVNHIVYHGTAYSPPGAPWPGWLFYASVEFNPRNPWWTDFAALNAYVTRVQSFLQAGTPDHDVLLYYPFYDRVAAGGPGRLVHFGGANVPSAGTRFEAAAESMQRRGFTYDYISDRQLAAVRVAGGALVTGGGGRYKTLVVPASRYVPLATFETILSLARAGARVVAFDRLPDDVAGFADLERRRSRFRAAQGRERVLTGDDLETLLGRVGVSREPLVDRGLQFARRRYGSGRSYFLSNPGDRDLTGWIPLDDPLRAAVVFDPMTGRRGAALARRSNGRLEVRVSIPRGQSLIVVTGNAPAGEPLPITASAGAALEVGGPWQVRFVSGGPELPAEQRLERLSSWTTFAGEAGQRFSGTAVYATTFPRPPGEADRWLLDLGEVRESARVRLNGRDLGTLIGPDFRLSIDRAAFAGTNVFEISVTNLMANRIAALDKASVRWRIFYNVNFPARLPANRGPDGLFTATRWEPMASGLLGPVTLTPMRDER